MKNILIKHAVSAFVLLVFAVLCGIGTFSFPWFQSKFWIFTAFVVTLADWAILLLPFTVFFFLWKRITSRSLKVASVIFLLAGLCLLEVVLRYSGHRPGFTCSKEEYSQIPAIPTMDSFIDYQTTMCDRYGVTKYNPYAKNRPGFINKEGFHSFHEFTQEVIDSEKCAGRTTVALFGDSYAFGNDADSGQAYVDHLNRTGKYAVFNFGVAGVDPAQYVALSEEYIKSKKLKFDMVLVSLCGANDMYPMPGDTVMANVPILYSTNAGSLYSRRGEDDVLLSARAAYQELLDEHTVFSMPGGSIIGTSVVASKLAGYARTYIRVLLAPPVYLFRRQFFDRCVDFAQLAHHYFGDHEPITLYPYVDKIRKNCQSVNTQAVFILIPGKEMVKSGKTTQIPGVISLDAGKLSAEDYRNNGPNAHPNNRAHRQIYEQIRLILDGVTR